MKVWGSFQGREHTEHGFDVFVYPLLGGIDLFVANHWSHQQVLDFAKQHDDSKLVWRHCFVSLAFSKVPRASRVRTESGEKEREREGCICRKEQVVLCCGSRTRLRGQEAVRQFLHHRWDYDLNSAKPHLALGDQMLKTEVMLTVSRIV
jgi:hypothetical protein